MTRSEQPTDTFADELEADSRQRAVGALLKIPPLRKLWGAQLTGTVGDRLALLVLVVLTAQAAAGAQSFGGGTAVRPSPSRPSSGRACSPPCSSAPYCSARWAPSPGPAVCSTAGGR